MRQSTACWAAAMLAAGVLAAALGRSPVSAAPPRTLPTSEQLQSWLAALDDDDYASRERATQRLHEAGDAAIAVLARGTLVGTPETAWRAGEALKRIAITGDEQTIDRVAAALEQVGHQGRTGMHQVVADIRARQKQLRHDRAAAQIRKLGGELSGNYGGLPVVGIEGIDMMPLDAGFIVEEPAGLEIAAMAEAAAAAAEAGAAAEAAIAEAGIAADDVEIGPSVRAALDELKKLVRPEAEKLREAVAEVFVPEVADDAPRAEELPAGDVGEFRELESLPLDEKEAPAEAAVAIDEFGGGEIVMLGGMGGMFFGGGFAVAADETGAVAAESLSLGTAWRGGDEGLKVLADLPEIVQVSIQGAPLTDAALKHLAALPKLSSMSLRGTRFSVEALRELHRARPAGSMFCQGEAMIGIHADTSGSCVLTSVYPGSGAAEAGLQTGDRIVTIEGLDIRDFSELTISVYGRQPGEKLKIEFEREGQKRTALVELKPRSELEPASR